MLKFERKSFKAGLMKIKDRKPKVDEKTGTPIPGEFVEGYFVVTPNHNGKTMEVQDEAFVLKTYPQFFKKA